MNSWRRLIVLPVLLALLCAAFAIRAPSTQAHAAHAARPATLCTNTVWSLEHSAARTYTTGDPLFSTIDSDIYALYDANLVTYCGQVYSSGSYHCSYVHNPCNTVTDYAYLELWNGSSWTTVETGTRTADVGWTSPFTPFHNTSGVQNYRTCVTDHNNVNPLCTGTFTSPYRPVRLTPKSTTVPLAFNTSKVPNGPHFGTACDAAQWVDVVEKIQHYDTHAPNWDIYVDFWRLYQNGIVADVDYCGHVEAEASWTCTYYGGVACNTVYALEVQIERWDTGLGHWVTAEHTTVNSNGEYPIEHDIFSPDTPTASGVLLRACGTDPLAVVVCPGSWTTP